MYFRKSVEIKYKITNYQIIMAKPINKIRQDMTTDNNSFVTYGYDATQYHLLTFYTKIYENLNLFLKQGK